ncbi:MAG: hypothetical protein P1R58_01835 [bacterium]|nr:hypothetical protein [bacterium]
METDGRRENREMSITIGKHKFDGPYTITKDIMNDPGIFAVIVANGDRGALIDVGESNNIRECVEIHGSNTRWKKFASTGTLCFAVLYTPSYDQVERNSIEQDIRSLYESNATK